MSSRTAENVALTRSAARASGIALVARGRRPPVGLMHLVDQAAIVAREADQLGHLPAPGEVADQALQQPCAERVQRLDTAGVDHHLARFRTQDWRRHRRGGPPRSRAWPSTIRRLKAASCPHRRRPSGAAAMPFLHPRSFRREFTNQPRLFAPAVAAGNARKPPDSRRKGQRKYQPARRRREDGCCGEQRRVAPRARRVRCSHACRSVQRDRKEYGGGRSRDRDGISGKAGGAQRRHVHVDNPRERPK